MTNNTHPSSAVMAGMLPRRGTRNSLPVGIIKVGWSDVNRSKTSCFPQQPIFLDLPRK